MKEFELNKNGWHVKLMYYIWGTTTDDFSNMCPFFWLTILNIVLVIPYTIIKGIMAIFKIIQNIEYNLQHKKRERYWELVYTRAIALKTEEDVKKFIDSEKNGKFVSSVIMNIKNNDLRKFALHYSQQLLEKASLEADAIKVMRSAKIKAMRNLPIAKFIGTVILILLGLALIGGTTLFIIMLTKAPIKLWLALGIVAGGGAVVLFLTFVIMYIVKRLERSDKKFPKILIFKPIISGIKTIWQVLYEFYKGRCPGINWKSNE